MGIFLILFPDEHHQQIHYTNHNNSISKKKPINFNLFPPSFSLPSSLKRTNSAKLLYKAQSAISICALLLFTILLIFTISTLPSTTTTTAAGARRDFFHQPRRQLNGMNSFTHALQGMGTLYRRGTRAMNDLIVAHAVESLTSHEFRLFLRLLHRSGTTSRSDLLFIFPSKSAVFDREIREENDYFMKLLDQYNNTITTQSNNYSSSFSSFKPTHFVKNIDKSKHTGEPIWGRRTRSNLSEAESRRLSYGSVVGFDVEELDPENSLSGFLDHIPTSLRRWACYPMILGRVRRNFKHVTLVDMKEVLLLDDPFDKIRGTAMESVLVINEKHWRRNSNKAQTLVTPTIIIGGGRGVRRLSDLMLTEIVRTSMQKKRRNSATESTLFNQLVENPFILHKVKLIASTESIPESISKPNHGMVKRGNANVDVHYILMKQICSLPVESTVYSDCYS